MATNAPSSSLTKTSSRRILRLNHYIGLILIAFIFVAVNMIGAKQFFRKNISGSTYTQIGSQSAELVRGLAEPVSIINFVSPSGDPVAELIGMDLERLLEDYRYKSNGKVEIRKVNPYVDFTEARSIAQEHKITTEENVLVLKYGSQTKVLNYRDLADVDTSAAFMGGPARLQAFKAEEAITSAIQSLAMGTKAKIVFLSGNGEYNTESGDRDPAGYSRLAEYIRRQNADVVKVNLAETLSIPADATLLVVAGPRQAYSAESLELIRAYLTRAEKPGRLLLLLDSGTKTGLEGLLASYGITFNDDLAVTRVSILGQVRLLGQAVATTFSEHPVTSWLAKSATNITLGPCRSLVVKAPETPGAAAPVALAMTPQSYWGESDYRGESAQFDKGKDTEGPLTLAAALDLGNVSNGTVKVPGTKVVAVGGGEFLTNQLIGGPQLDFFLNAMNWLADRESSLGITPKTPQEFRVALDEKQKQRLTLIVLLVVPFTGAAVGFLVWLRRRK